MREEAQDWGEAAGIQYMEGISEEYMFMYLDAEEDGQEMIGFHPSSCLGQLLLQKASTRAEITGHYEKSKVVNDKSSG